MTELRDLGVVVTGGGSGLGLTTARRMAAHGARVACLDLDPSAAEAPLIGIVCDVSDDASVRALVRRRQAVPGQGAPPRPAPCHEPEAVRTGRRDDVLEHRVETTRAVRWAPIGV